MAFRIVSRRIVRCFTACSNRSLVPSISSMWSSPISYVSAFQMHTRSYAKAKKTRSKASSPALVVDDGNDQESGYIDNGEAAKALTKANKNMNGAVVNFSRVLNQMQPGRTDAGIFDELHVQAYGQHVPLAQVAQVAVVGTHALSLTVYDPMLKQDVKKAIEGMNPVFSVREDLCSLEISFPKMSKETRAELLKSTKKQAEQARQHVRRVRQDAMNHVKKLKENLSEDVVEFQKERIQMVTDSAIADIDKLLAVKEKDLNTV